MAKSVKLTDAECKRRALLAADWFVNTQFVQRRPQWDANHGRVIYNYHMPTGQTVLGLSWSQGRAIMCLLAGWQLTGRSKYLDAAVRCGDYLRYALQQMDRRHGVSFGSLREEVPTSRFSYPRDGIEGAFGLLMLHAATGEADYLERCELFADWYLTNAYVAKERWVRGRVGFDDDEDFVRFSYIQGGGSPFFWHLYGLTGKAKYQRMVRVLGDGMLERFIDEQSGAIVSGPPVAARSKEAMMRHHAMLLNGRPVVFNDDGSSIALTCAHAATGKPTSKYLDAALRYGDWLIDACPRPIERFVADSMQSVFLTELTAVTGQARYAGFARGLMAGQVRLQVEAPGKPDRHGGYRGEDEPAEAYVKGSTGKEFLTTRTTAYSTLALFRLHGGVHGPSYSALGLKTLRKG